MIKVVLSQEPVLQSHPGRSTVVHSESASTSQLPLETTERDGIASTASESPHPQLTLQAWGFGIREGRMLEQQLGG